MEKIKQALDRARTQRNGKLDGLNVTPGNATQVEDIQYTQTKTVSGNKVLHHKNRLLNFEKQDAYSDSFKILSTQVIQRMSENQWNSVAITSACQNAGKTTTAINLGISIAKEVEYTVLLVDLNLRQPKVHEYFGMPKTLGLSDYLQSELNIADLLVKPEDINHLVIIPGGTLTMNSSELLGSPKMSLLVEELKNRYPKRIVIFDLPHMLDTAEALSFAPLVDCALVVVSDDETKESDLRSTIGLLSVTNVIGTVLNKAKY